MICWWIWGRIVGTVLCVFVVPQSDVHSHMHTHISSYQDVLASVGLALVSSFFVWILLPRAGSFALPCMFFLVCFEFGRQCKCS